MTYNPDNATFAAPDRRQSLQQQWREVSARIDAEDAARRAAEADTATLPAATDAAGRTLRHDGWTPDRQRAFLSAIAEGDTVERACRIVGLSVSSAYAFRQRAAGAAFALGWHAAALVARDRLADRLMARAIDGQIETITRPDGSVVERHRYDNRIAMGVLNRLDRMVEQAPADPAAAASSHAARLVAQDFEAFLATIEQARGPADAGLFLARRATAEAADLEPVRALARADRFVRSGASLPHEVDTSDLDPTRRHDWTADQWRRADAAGLLRIAPVEETRAEVPLPPLVDRADEPVWWDDETEDYRTRFPLAPGAEWVDQDGRYGDPDYARALTADERALLDAADDIDTEANRIVDTAAREAWFAGLETQIAAAEQAAGAGPGAGDAAGDRPFPGERRGPVAGCSTAEDDAPHIAGDIETPASEMGRHSSVADAAVNAA